MRVHELIRALQELGIDHMNDLVVVNGYEGGVDEAGMPLAGVVALDENEGIGCYGKHEWLKPEDVEYRKRVESFEWETKSEMVPAVRIR